MQYKIMNKDEVLNLINNQAKNLTVLKNKTTSSEWSINELIYCLEYLDYEITMCLNIQIDGGISIPISGGIPCFVPSHIRAKNIKITDVEIYNVTCDISDIDEEYIEGEKPVYIIIVEEV